MWLFMETECRISIKKPFKISLIAAGVRSERLFTAAMTVTSYSLLPAAAEIGIARLVSKIKRSNGSINRCKNFYPPIISS